MRGADFMIFTTDYPVTFETMKENMEKRLEELRKGLEIIEKAEMLAKDSVEVKSIEGINCIEEYHFSEYEGGNDYIESCHLIEVTGDKNFDAVIIGNRDEDYNHIFQVYAPNMSPEMQLILEEKVREYLLEEEEDTTRYPYAFNTPFSIVFINK
jgi:hypothetical protein